MLPGFLQRSGVDASFPQGLSWPQATPQTLGQKASRSESQWVKTRVLLLQDPSKHHIHSDEEDLEVKKKQSSNFLNT